MAYIRYFKRNGKVFGPYYYESYRDKNGKVKKRYVGTSLNNKVKENVSIVKEIKENKDFYSKLEENIDKKNLNEITSTKSSIIILVLLILVLISVDLFSLLHYL